VVVEGVGAVSHFLDVLVLGFLGCSWSLVESLGYGWKGESVRDI
jgi:hypothetical protein